MCFLIRQSLRGGLASGGGGNGGCGGGGGAGSMVKNVFEGRPPLIVVRPRKLTSEISSSHRLRQA